MTISGIYEMTINYARLELKRQNARADRGALRSRSASAIALLAQSAVALGAIRSQTLTRLLRGLLRGLLRRFGGLVAELALLVLRTGRHVDLVLRIDRAFEILDRLPETVAELWQLR